MSLNVLIISGLFPSEQRPGDGIYILRYAQALRELGHQISVLRVVPLALPLRNKWREYTSIPSRYNVDGFPVRSLRAIIPPRRLGLEFVPWQVHLGVAREIKRFQPHVLHANFLIESGQVAVRHNVPTVVTAHGSDAYSWPYGRPGLLRAAREAIVKATRVTAVSNFIRERVLAIAPREVEVIWNGGDERIFYPRERAAARAELGLPPNRFVIAFAGGLLRAKGVFDLLEAAAGLKERSPIVLIAGRGPEEDALREHAKRDGVDMRLMGQIPQEEIAAMFSSADVVTLPSYNEGLPNVVCEGMLCGRTVVASAVGGIPEVVESGRSGLLIHPGNVGELREALASCADNTPARQRMEQQAHDFASVNLTWRVAARRYDRVLREAASSDLRV
jgi:teichuronic acid biosynthesis glycosyltransferase TuaC